MTPAGESFSHWLFKLDYPPYCEACRLGQRCALRGILTRRRHQCSSWPGRCPRYPFATALWPCHFDCLCGGTGYPTVWFSIMHAETYELLELITRQLMSPRLVRC